MYNIKIDNKGVVIIIKSKKDTLDVINLIVVSEKIITPKPIRNIITLILL